MNDDLSTLGHLARWAELSPDRTFLEEARDEGRISLSYAELVESGLRWSRALRALGVGARDVVVSLLPTGVDAVQCWIGTAWLRALDAGIHPEYRGQMLLRLLRAVSPKVVVVGEAQVDRLEEVLGDLEGCRAVVAFGARAVTCPPGVASLMAKDLLEEAEPVADLAAPLRQDVACIVFTSGTTGPSKPVAVPWGNYLGTLPVWADLTRDDTFYSPFALCHSAGRSPFTWIGVPGGRWVIRDGFKTERFWRDIAEFGCTTTQLIPIMIDWLLSREDPDELRHTPLQRAVTAPVTERALEFQDRFHIDLRTVYGMSEVGMVICRSPRLYGDWRSCGRPTAGFTVQVVDENDYEVGDGEVGELIVRADRPWSLNNGYYGMAEETLAAWRNGWFHTGDSLYRSESGDYYFVDRKKDALRRRGENVSSRELEEVIATFPGLVECAVIGVPGGEGDQEIKVVAVLAEGTEPDPAALVRHLQDRVPRFMVPRYVEFVGVLPRTEVTGRVQKARLRDDPFTPGTWDRLVATGD